MDVTDREQSLRKLAQASAWRTALAEADADTSDDFEAWLAADPANESAWDQVQSSWTVVGEQANSPELLALRAGALARARHHSRPRRISSSSSWIPRIAACLLILLVGSVVIGFSVWQGSQPLTYATTFGERRTITLDDGSKISLDVNSEVQVRYSAEARRLKLLRGQARFDVAKDEDRPFSVRARDRLVVATGTAFNVDMLGSKVLVTLIEGQVVVKGTKSAVESADTLETETPEKVVLEAGEQLIADTTAPAQVEKVNIEKATSWEQGYLVFDDEPLAAIAERVSRYSEKPVSVAPAVAGMRVSGVFVAGDVNTFVDTVSRYLPVDVRKSTRGLVLEKSS